jgi:pimeloyl-ACP methyl ester carboxylesterase
LGHVEREILLPSTTETLDIRGLRYNVRHWGAADAPKLFLLHGWMDSSATFQFVVDAFRKSWHVIAPDWRGYGESEWLGRPYWFPDYYADLEVLLDHYSPTHRPNWLVTAWARTLPRPMPACGRSGWRGWPCSIFSA